ncbi:MAG: hypothetical protein K6F84_04265 [Lachnospiraceae bacterium]|nr:hypothetical protein [Lachnospiraceae bacterium]
MSCMDEESKKKAFEEALKHVNLPVLTLDNKWYRLLDEVGKKNVKEKEEELNTLLKRQGKLNTEIKAIKTLKKKLLNEIVENVDESDVNVGDNPEVKEKKAYIDELNEKLDAYEDENLELPRQINEINHDLMMDTIERCYDIMKDNSEEIAKTAEWVTSIRIELKKRLINKQEMEQKNQDIYSYMHDIFGPNVVDLFDMTYDPENKNGDSNKS